MIWIATACNRLPDSLLSAIARAEKRFVSHVSDWEIQIKHERHGAGFDFSLDHLELTMKAFSCTELPVEYRDIRELDQMQFLHPDPFDRMLISQGSRCSVYLATLGSNIVRTFETSKAFRIFTDQAAEE